MSLDKNLIGWDAINPEFNFFINFRHVFSAFWQENQGVGLLAGHGFAAVLPHNIIIYLLALIAPKEILRTIFTFLCFYIGGIGIYVFMKHILHHYILKTREHLKSLIPLLALTATLHYWVNLGTVQMFYIQLEAFIFHFAALPWLFYTTILLLEKTSKKRFILFVIVNFFATTQGFIPPLFVAYAFGLGIFLAIFTVSNKFSAKSLKKAGLVILLTTFINAYWLIPLGYYTITRSNVYLNSYNNLVSTPEFINKNKKYGELKDVALIKGFMFEAVDSSTENSITYVLQPWVSHINQAPIQALGYLFFGIIIAGIIASLFFLKNWVSTALMGVFFFFFTGITTDFPPFSFVTNLLQNYMPVYRQAFRAAFTKFALGVAFSYSIFFCIGITAGIVLIFRFIKSKILLKVILFIAIFFLLVFGYPYFSGNFFYHRLFVKIPSSYLNLIEYFKAQPDGRIADMPQDCPEGWFTYNWNYTGSGFYWYAIRQPIMSRTFDVWSNYNENYYWEMTQALHEGDYTKASQILEKYNVKWVLYDNNVMHCRKQKALLYSEPFLEYLKSSPDYQLEKTFTADGIRPIYIFSRISNISNSFIEITPSLLNIGPHYNWNDNDTAIKIQQKYKTDDKNPYDIYYPFRSVFSKRKAEESEENISDDDKAIYIKTKIPTSLQTNFITLPAQSTYEKTIPMQLRLQKNPKSNKYSLILTLTSPILSVDSIEINTKNKEFLLGSFNLPKLEKVQFSVNSLPVAFDTDLTSNSVLYSNITNTIDVIDTSTNNVLFKWTSDNQSYMDLINQPTIVKMPVFSQGVLKVTIPKVKENISDITYTSDLTKIEPKPCNELEPNNRNSFNIDKEGDVEYLRLFSQNSRQCIVFNLPNFSMNSGYLLKVNSRKITGSNPVFYVSDAVSHHFIDIFLYNGSTFKSNYIVLPPGIKNGIGYDIYFDNLSQNKYPTINDFSYLEVNQIPYNFLKEIVVTKTKTGNVLLEQNVILPQNNILVEHNIETNYTVSYQPNSNVPKNIILYQSYDPQWRAYYVDNLDFISSNFPSLFGREIKNHIQINNWANGWELDNSTTKDKSLNSQIVIIFWPQYLQYIGFATLGLCFAGIFFWKSKK
jgi:hypothetical protein